MGSYWPHHAETYQVAGHSSTAPIAATAAHGLSRNHQPTATAMPRSAMLAGQLHQGGDRGIGGIGHGPERRLQPGQRAPDPGHDGGEGQVLVVGVGPAVHGDPVDPQRRTGPRRRPARGPARPTSGRRCPPRTGRGWRSRAGSPGWTNCGGRRSSGRRSRRVAWRPGGHAVRQAS